jgi:transcriptional regulator with XRE-family HTH domain
MFSEVKTVERDLARELRRTEGLPINEIAQRLGVSKSSVSYWVRDVELTSQQHEALRAMNPAYNRQLNGSRTNAVRHRANRVAAQERGRVLARQCDDADIRVTCNLFPDHVERQHEIEQFWLDIVGVPETSLCRSTVNTYSKYSKKKRQEYAGFERPAWLE